MKNIRPILIGATAALALIATPKAKAAAPRQKPDPVTVVAEQTLCQANCPAEPNAIEAVVNAPGAPREKADPVAVFAVPSAQLDADVVNGMDQVPGEPRMKPDFAPPLPAPEEMDAQ
jgi:hypothetical protein